jgi:multiple sugar transport system permease protein
LIRTHRRQALALLAPYLLGAFLLVMLPAGISFALAFTHYNGIRPPVFAEWYNFT